MAAKAAHGKTCKTHVGSVLLGEGKREGGKEGTEGGMGGGGNGGSGKTLSL